MDNTQIKEVRTYLENGHSISSMVAFEKFGVTRLSAIIYILRHNEGMNIVSTMETVKNRYGHTTNYSTYKLVKGDTVNA